MKTLGAQLSGGDALHRLYQPGIWLAIHLPFHLSVRHAFEKGGMEMMCPGTAVGVIHKEKRYHYLICTSPKLVMHCHDSHNFFSGSLFISESQDAEILPFPIKISIL